MPTKYLIVTALALATGITAVPAQLDQTEAAGPIFLLPLQPLPWLRSRVQRVCQGMLSPSRSPLS